MTSVKIYLQPYIYIYIYTNKQHNSTRRKHAIGSLQLLFLQTIWNTTMKKIVHLLLLFFLKYRETLPQQQNPVTEMINTSSFDHWKEPSLSFFPAHYFMLVCLFLKLFFVVRQVVSPVPSFFSPLKTSSTSQFLILRQYMKHTHQPQGQAILKIIRYHQWQYDS